MNIEVDYESAVKAAAAHVEKNAEAKRPDHRQCANSKHSVFTGPRAAAKTRKQFCGQCVDIESDRRGTFASGAIPRMARSQKKYRILWLPQSTVIAVIVGFVCCAGKATRLPPGTEVSRAIMEKNVAGFPEGADRSLAQLKKMTHEDVTLLAWSRDFARGSALLLELESTKSLSDLKLAVNGKDLKLTEGQGCVFALFANSPDSQRKENKLLVSRGSTPVAEFTLPVVQKEYPVAVSKMNVQNFSNQSKPMSQKTIDWIEEGRKKKLKAFVSVDGSYLTQELKYPRDEHKITSPFFIKRVYERFKMVKGKKQKLKGRTSYHGGTDLKGLTGAPIFAVANGVVTLAEHLYYDGKIVMIDHGNGIISGYLHQSELLVKEGDRVVAGQQIGRSGNTGMVTGPHLHIFLSVHGVKADPLSLLVLPIRARN